VATAEQVMVIDDEPTTRLAVTLMCRTLGLPEAMAFASGHEALAALTGNAVQVDLILCDLDMPEMDGMEFIRRASELADAPAMMILSGHDGALVGSVERMGRAYGLRMVGSVRKPLSRDRLKAALDELSETFPSRPSARASLDAAVVDALIDSGRFEAHFQPQVSLGKDGPRVRSAEVLARLVQPGGEVDLPAVFLPRLAEHNAMAELTFEILDRTLSAMAGWPDTLANLGVSLNVTPVLVDDMAIIGALTERIEASGIRRDRLVFEVVETAVSADKMRFTENAARLRLRGFGLAIDDYGQGHSTLDQLRRLPFTELKIDRAFVVGLDRDPDNHAIVANTIAMAKDLAMTVIAEGVETESEARALRNLGCDYAQGYLYARAMPSDAFVAFCAEHGVVA
jgi:EAL domain-containing protein (putative c-di-GMP-specific phosphodiesterase class I)/CheY-like chemotaxis protein